MIEVMNQIYMQNMKKMKIPQYQLQEDVDTESQDTP
jgi:hypothetical protein